MIKILALIFAILFSNSAAAVYKCEDKGKTIYSDAPCSGSKVSELDTSQTNASAQDAAEANMRNAQEKSKLKCLEEARRKQEAKEEKEQQKRMQAQAVLQKKCTELALKKKWSEEDAAQATGKAEMKAKKTAARHAERYESVCGKLKFNS